MQLFHIRYDGERFPVFASTHCAARRLGVRHLANILGAVEESKVAVVDPAIACAIPTDVERRKALAAHFLSGPIHDFVSYQRRDEGDLFRERKERWL